jgi:hypothetical protein
MNETRRTGTYVAVAVVLGLLAWWASPPVEISPQELQAANIGKPFYPDFNATEATSIRVAAFDEGKAEPKSFAVTFQNGKWTIPSHHNYPADGADRLAETATSFKGIKREELAIGGDTEQSHEQLGVVDPLDEKQANLKGRGQRITITKGDDPLVDLVIGKQVKDRPGYYYVRMPKENSTYVAKLSLNLSTKFSDWIETDLLKLNRDDLREIVIDHSTIDEVARRLVEGEIDTLTRDKTADPWKLDGLDEAKEELDTSKINTMLGALDDLKLVGVRPKPKGLGPDLSIDREYVKHPLQLQMLQEDLAARGYIISKGRNDDLHLYPNAGELVAATNKGVVYTLKFGEVFTGDESEIEVGGGKEDAKQDGDKTGDAKKDGDKDDKDKDKADAGKQPSRYLFITTHFDEKYLGPAPVEPERPEGLPADDSESDSGKKTKGKPQTSDKKTKAPPQKSGDDDGPAGTAPSTGDAESDESAGSAKKDDQCGPPSAEDDPPASKEADKDEKPAPNEDAKEEKNSPDDDTKAEEDKPAAKKEGAADGKKEPAASDTKPAPEKEQKKPEDLKKEYDNKVKNYKSDLKDHEDKIEAGKKQVDELNARFNDWYYVISAENFNKLLIAQKDFVKEKSKPAGDDKSKDKPSDKPADQDPFTPDSKESPDSDDGPDEADGAKDTKAKDAGDAKKSDAAKSADKPKKPE